ncbi:hypothetical protein OP10G_0297 [Fimbriimonas ginsengisoli Gsoil 348]|uniref:Uncharacterized protein n=1 Tax=Fimbriimonas ginsengisoli Gsoil 348 TaxID=661478 RepID=A0A068NLN2_FIMGI|nr:hypothetical protein OP10G_0297 [Fimbriimonas ginsengisoli Gsoil 348]
MSYPRRPSDNRDIANLSPDRRLKPLGNAGERVSEDLRSIR